MKKYLGCILALTALTLLAGCAKDSQDTITAGDLLVTNASQVSLTGEQITPSSIPAGEYLELADAKAAALDHAGLAESDVTFLTAEMDYDDGQVFYDVEFYTDGTEYDYEIDAVTGTILSYDYDVEHYTPAVTTPATSSTSSYIGEAAAKTAALNHAGLTEADVVFLQAKLDRDDGRMVYDVEFYAGSAEYDYEIDAATGAVVSYDYDVEHYTPAVTTPAASSTSSYIGEAAAKTAALNHAGLTEADVSFIQVKLDRDDGRMVYDVEFYAGSTEYDYEIDAVSGSILSYESESNRRG